MKILEMKKNMSFLVIMTRVVFFAMILTICLSLVVDRVRAQETIPEAEQLKQLSQDTMLDFALAIKAKDFTMFHRNIAKLWQAQTSKEELANVFKSLSDQNIDLINLQDLDPIFTSPPQLDENGWLILKGHYPTQPSITYFALKYLEEDSVWKLVGINVNLQEEPLPESEKEEIPTEDEPVQPTQESQEWEQLSNESIVFYEKEQYTEALGVAQKALDIGREVFGTEHPNVADTLFNMGLFHHYLEQYAEAETFYKQAFDIREKILEPDHPDMVTVLEELASVYNIQEKYVEAELLYQRLLILKKNALGADHLDIGYLLHELAILYSLQEKHAEAEPLYQRALEIEENTLEAEHVDIGYLLHNLAFTYESQGKYAEAEPLYQRALAIKEKTLDPDDLEIARTLVDLGGLYNYLGKYVEAEPLHRRGLLIREKVLGSEHPDVAESLDNLGEWHDLQDRHIEAELLYQRALAIVENALEPNDPMVTAISENLSNLYKKIGREEKTEQFTDTSESPLWRLLRFVPDTPEYRKYFTYGDAAAWHNSWKIPRIDSVTELENLDQNSHAYWRFVMPSQTIPPDSLGFKYLGTEDQRGFYGFDFFNLDRFIGAGETPDQLTVAEFKLDNTSIADALTTSGYNAEVLETGGTLYSILRDYQFSRNIPMRTGQLGNLNRIALLDGQMVIAKATAIITNALLAYNGKQPSLADSPDYAAAVKALEHPELKGTGELVGAIFMAGSQLVDPMWFLDPSAHEEAIQRFKDYAQKPTLPPYSLVSFATRHTQGASFLILAVVFPQGTDANAAANVLADRLQPYVSVVHGIPFDDYWTFEKATGIEVQGLPVTLAVMRVDDPPPTPQGASHVTADVFTWPSLISKRDILFLLPGEIPEWPE